VVIESIDLVESQFLSEVKSLIVENNTYSLMYI